MEAQLARLNKEAEAGSATNIRYIVGMFRRLHCHAGRSHQIIPKSATPEE
jgi:hypothetical protein